MCPAFSEQYALLPMLNALDLVVVVLFFLSCKLIFKKSRGIFCTQEKAIWSIILVSVTGGTRTRPTVGKQKLI